MTYLHDYTQARKTLRDTIIPKLVAALMPTMDMLGMEFERVDDALNVTLPAGVLPEGYRMRIVFEPYKVVQWRTPDGKPTKGPGF